MKLIHEYITDYAGEHPSKTVIQDERGEMSYGELEAQSASLARGLARAGVRPGDSVAVYVPYAKEILLGAVSAWRAGAVYLPLDEAYPVDRLHYMLADSAAAAILTVRALWDRKPLRFASEKVLFMDAPEESCNQALWPAALTEDSPAMLLYTSGTTGRPKGVLHSHSMLVHLVDWMNIHEGAEMNENTRTGVMSNLTFVGTQMFLFGPVSRGGAVCLAPEAARNDVGLLHQFVREADVTHIFLPAALAAIMAEDYDIRGIFIFAAGEKLRNFKPHCPGNVLINSYGSTETSGVLSKKIQGDEPRILVGRPFSNTKAQIADEQLRPLPPGQAGELLISNSFMAQSYYKLPELSREKWATLDGVRWYRTGDRALCTEEGDIDLLGRIDNMVKLRGFRIETGEVEAQVANAAAKLGQNDAGQIVVTVKNVGGTDRLCCYYESARELDVESVKAEISKTLAEYMIPEVWVRMDAMPRNLNGKVMRQELPQPKRESGSQIIGALDSEVLARMVYTAAEVLDTKELISPDDRFTDLGGTSLTAMKYVARLREQGIKVTSAQVLQLNVLRRIAETAEVAYEQLWSPEEYARVREDFASRGEHIQKVLPITPAQDEMLFTHILHPDMAELRNALIVHLDSRISEDVLRRALDMVSEANEELRSAMVYHHVSAVQQVITDRKIPLDVLEVSEFDDRQMERLRDQLLHTPIDLQRSCLVQVTCVNTENGCYIYFVSHDIIFVTEQWRVNLLQFISALEESYPEDAALRGWRETAEKLCTEASVEARKNADRVKSIHPGRDIPPEMCVYSENDGPKLVFVHTANTGSAAYYHLAARIGDRVSFSVIEPFNLYHMDEAVYGIKNIAAHYIEILKRCQPEGPYILGGWCYGGMIAHEMACQLEQAGDEVRLLVMLDSHAITTDALREISKGMTAEVNRTYFETSPLFADLRESGMLEAMVANAVHASEDMVNHLPSVYHGKVLYFKPDQLPSGISPENRRYWEKMMQFSAGNYEHYCRREKLRIVHTPHEHDLMMDDASLDIIVPELMKAIEGCTAEEDR